MTPHNHMIKGTCDLVNWSSSFWTTSLPSFAFIGLRNMEMKCFSFVTWPHVTTWSMVMWLCGWEPWTLSHHCQIWCFFWPYGSVDITGGDITWPHDQKRMWLGNGELLILCRQCAKFHGYGSCRSGAMFFTFSSDSTWP